MVGVSLNSSRPGLVSPTEILLQNFIFHFELSLGEERVKYEAEYDLVRVGRGEALE